MVYATLEIVIILLLILINGFFAMAEIAIISARKPILDDLSKRGTPGSKEALDLADNPNRFLSTVQVGITTIGILMGAYGGATIANHLEFIFKNIKIIRPYADTISVAIVVIIVSYLSLVFGELVPKRLALSKSEEIASFAARPMNFISLISMPFVHLLSLSTEAVLFMLGIKGKAVRPITEYEITYTIDLGRKAGLVEPDEQIMVKRVFEFGDRQAHSIMTPRTEVTWLDLTDSPEENMSIILQNHHSRFPVVRENPDQIAGVINARDLLQRPTDTPLLSLEPYLQTPLFIPEHMSALRVLQFFRQTPLHIAIVIDEYGGFRGIITAYDLLQAIVGELPAEKEPFMPSVKKIEENTWMIDGSLPVQEFKVYFNINELPEEQRYGTIGGFVMHMLGHIPSSGDQFTWNEFEFTVTEMMEHRVGKLKMKGPAVKNENVSNE